MGRSETGPAHVMVVDDDPAIRGFLAALLESEGYRVTLAGDGAAAMRAVEAAMPDAVVLDLAMPVMDGWQLAAALRRRHDAPPLIFMSAGYDAQREAEKHGAQGYLSKPFTTEQLLDCIKKLLASGE